jgi:probable addiction module antidote protein
MARVSEFDPSAFFDDDKVVAEYLTAAPEDDNPGVFLAAVGHVAKARGMSAIGERAGLGRESLYKAFAPGAKPSLGHGPQGAPQPRRDAPTGVRGLSLVKSDAEQAIASYRAVPEL